jgi:selenocysteine lyase/cysteine desulfurase
MSESRLGGRPFEVVMKKQVEVWEMERQEKQRMKELKDRLSFVPHLHFINESSLPSPIHVVSFIGVAFFKK